MPIHDGDGLEESAVARVLVIDDEDVIGAVLRYAFLEQGHETLLAGGGRQGIERALAEHPDAIVLDLMMPEVTGHDVLAALRDDAAQEDVPILVLTAVTQSRERERCLAEGADKVMTKPFDPREVASVIDGMLNLPPVPSFSRSA
jgi:DNA-binding response OmpR family regulator